MKITPTFLAMALCILTATVNAQTSTPEGYTKASITLADGTVQSGYIKDNIKKSASVTFIDASGNNKKVYEGADINGVKKDAENFICINGDFFKTLSTGKLNFLQKSSNASGKVSYNGAEPIFSSGTEGKIGDYFIYADKKLKLLTKKTVASFIDTDLIGCAEAIEKAKAANGDIAKMQGAIETYNSYSIK
ncbi:hypothetical protein [Ferruginibacter sp.]